MRAAVDIAGCPSETELADFVAGAASEREQRAIEGHIDACERCGATLRDYARAFASEAGETDARPAPAGGDAAERFAGRYRIDSCVGFGAGGTVYRAHDSELDRVVALKVLGTRTEGSTQPASHWTREAKVMAKVVHPNVVTVHDVGVADDQLFIAAEFVEGCNLDEWRRESTRAWAEVLEVFVEAGRGLAAIHERGLVHRDFKPHNVMVGRDGRVRVTDFGLARLLPDLDTTELDLTQDSAAALAVAETLVSRTRPGTLVGTPAYMAPEQLRGEPADARSDQFSFCVSLYEALWGERPFAGKTVLELSEHVCNDAPRRPPARPRVPRWLVQVVFQGLSREPDARFPDMHALLHALTEAPRRRRQRRVSLVVAAGFGIVGVGSYAAAGLTGSGCDAEVQRIDRIWNDDARVDLMTSLGTNPEIAHEARQELDGWAQTWRDVTREACDMAGDRASARQQELQRGCLDRRLSELRAALEVLDTIDEPARTLDVVSTLGSARRCADLDALEDREPQWGSPLARMLAHEVAGDLDRAEAARAAGNLVEARSLAEAVVARVDDSGHHAVRAEALLELGQILSAQKEAEAAERALRDAVWAAEASGHVEVAARGWIELVTVLGNLREDYEEGRRAAERARAAVHRMGDPTAALELAANEAVTASVHGLYEEALEQQLDALARARTVYGPEHPQVARIHFNVAAVLARLGRLDEAVEYARNGLAMFEGRFSVHPTLVDMLNTLGALEVQRNDIEQGRAYLERGIALAEEVLREGHPTRVTLLSNLAQIDARDERYADAAERYRDVLELQRAAHGPRHPSVALALHNLAWNTERAGDRDGAIEIYREALEMRADTQGPDHPGTAATEHAMGLALASAGELDVGIEHMERALAVRERAKVDPYLRASSKFGLARAYEKRGELDRAIEHARAAHVHLEEIAPRQAEEREQVARWIAEHQR